MPTQLHLLGAPQALVDGQLQNLTNNKALLLAAYLAYKEDWALRDELLLLFWPDDVEKKARHNLSQLLYLLKNQQWLQVSDVELEAESDKYRLVMDTDVRAFREAHGAGAWARAYTTYTGPLLNISLNNSSNNFEHWLQLERETLQQSAFETALNYAQTLEQQNNFSEASTILKDVLKQDALAEEALQAYVRNLYQLGQRVEAIKAFDTFKTRLKDELDMEPLEQTLALMTNLQNSQAKSQTSEQPQLEHIQVKTTEFYGKPAEARTTLPKSINADDVFLTEPKLRNIPVQLTPFVGRDINLAEIADFLVSGDTRLLTLLGPGGMGKTRLAIQTLLEQAGSFQDGGVFVGLAILQATEKNTAKDTGDTLENLRQEIAKAIGISFTEKESSKTQLINYLRDKALLIVLDNFEHLLDASSIITDILESSPKTKLIVTSRTALGFQSEWVYEVKGLSLPPIGASESVEFHDASQLFIRRARRVDAHFRVEETDREHISKICRVLGGVPLGLELAANWLRVLSLEDIATELSKNLDLLESSQQDLPPRHQSLHTIFEQSWTLLNQEEREALMKLTVFQGSFSKKASDSITKIPVKTLLSLSNKSMIYRSANGRYERHPLVFEFSLEKAKQHRLKEQLPQLQTEHARYYADFLEDQEQALNSAKQQDALATIQLERENIRVAWQWMIENHREDLLAQSLPSLKTYFDAYTLSTEAIQTFDKALTLTDPSSTLHAHLLSYKGHFLTQMSDFTTAKTCLFTAWEHFQSLNTSSEKDIGLAETALSLSILVRLSNDYAKASEYLAISLANFKKNNSILGQAKVLQLQGKISDFTGDFSTAEKLLTESLELYQKLDYQRGIAEVLAHLADTQGNLGNIDLAKEYIQSAYAIQQSFETQNRQTSVYDSLAKASWKIADYALAETFTKEKLEIETLTGQRGEMAVSLTYLGILNAEKQDFEAAKRYCLESLSLTKELGLQIPTIMNLNKLGEQSSMQGDFASANQYYHDALLECKKGSPPAPVILYFLGDYAKALSMQQNFEKIFQILFTIKNHPALDQSLKGKVTEFFDKISLSLDASLREAIVSQCVEGDLEHLVNQLLS